MKGKWKSLHNDRNKKINFRLGQKCPNCLKAKLEPCECKGCKKRNKQALVCKTCHFLNF